MSYRDDDDALHARKDSLQRELDEAKKKLSETDDLAFKAARMERELAEIEARLRGEKKRLPMLDNLRIASPCTASWDEMKGDDRVRFCGHCQKNVFNLSAMSRDEAEALIIATQSKICVRMYRRADGTVLTEDCPEGVKKKRRKRLAAAIVGGAAVAAATAFAAVSQRETHVVQGGIHPAIEPATVPVPPSLPVVTTPSFAGPGSGMGQAVVMGEPRPEMGAPPVVPPTRTHRRR